MVAIPKATAAVDVENLVCRTLEVCVRAALRDYTNRGIFSMDLNGIYDSEVCVANMDGADPDSGTAWETAAFYIGGKQVLQYRTDFRGVGEANLCGYNIMLWESADIRILHSCLDPKNTIEALADLVHDKLTNQHAS